MSFYRLSKIKIEKNDILNGNERCEDNEIMRCKIFDSISKCIRSSFSAFLQTELSLLTYCNTILLSMPSEIKFEIQF